VKFSFERVGRPPKTVILKDISKAELVRSEGEVKEEGAGERADRRRSEPAEQSIPRHLVPAHDETELLGRAHQKTINPAEIDG
jgi:hypothetical protein